MENEKKDTVGMVAVYVFAAFIIGIFFYALVMNVTSSNQNGFCDSNATSSLSDSDKNFIINVALQAPTYSDWCIMNGGTWMPTNQKELNYLITKQEAGQLMQQGKEPIQDSNGNYYATIVTIERICGVVQ